MERNDRYDLAVIGLGLIGVAALRHAALTGQRAIGIGPGEPAEFATHPGVFSSHYDSGRITRLIDSTYEWALLARRAIAEYPTIAATGGVEFHHPVGVVYVAKAPAVVAATREVIGRLAIPAVEVAADSDPRMYLPGDATVFAEPAPAGFIDPRRLIVAQLAAATTAGADVVRHLVTNVSRANGGWGIEIADGRTVVAERVIVAGGPHTDEIAGLPVRPLLNVRPENVVQAVIGPAEQGRLQGLPSILSADDDPLDDYYIVPPTRYPDGTVRVKLGATLGPPRYFATRAERTAWMRGGAYNDELDALRNVTLRVLPGLSVERWEVQPCLITDTPTHVPYVDHIADGMVLAAGCNGYAAKSSDALGALAATLATEGRWTDRELDRDRFRILER